MPPIDPKGRKWYFKKKEKYFRYLKLYGNSLAEGVDMAKIITVKEEVPKKKKGKNKDGKMVGIFVTIKFLFKFLPQ